MSGLGDYSVGMFRHVIIWSTVALAIIPGYSVRCGEALPASLRPIVEHVQTNRDGRAAWTINFAAFEGDRSGLPIGVFDSGIGGLTVLEAILQLDAFNNDTLRPGADGRPDFAGEKFIYFGDQANMPYGNYPSQGQEDFLRELIIKDAVFLLGRRWRDSTGATLRYDKPPVKAIVIACNTATAYGLEDIRAASKEWKLDVPVIGVVEAAAREVAAGLPRDGKPGTVAVLATVGTCSSQAYPKAIRRSAGQAGKAAPTVVQQGSARLAEAIERGPLSSVAKYAHYDVVALLETHREIPAPIDTVVLGCTHFPLARPEIVAAFASEREAKGRLLAKDLRFIDPSQSVARELFVELVRARVRNRNKNEQGIDCDFFFSVGATEDHKGARKTGQLDVEQTVVVPLTVERLPGSSAGLVKALPAVWKELGEMTNDE